MVLSIVSIWKSNDKKTIQSYKETLLSRGYDQYELIAIGNIKEIKKRKDQSDKAERLYDKALSEFNQNAKNQKEVTEKIQLRYHYRSWENISPIRRKLNQEFKFETFELKSSKYNAGDINYIKFGKEVNPQVVKILLYLLLSAGREIKDIHIHENNKGITIASDSKAIKCKTLDVEKIENLVDNIKTQIDNKTIDVSNYHSCENYPAQTE